MNMRLILASLTMAALTACGGSDNSQPATSSSSSSSSSTSSSSSSSSVATATGTVKVTLSFPVATSVAPTATGHDKAASLARAQPQSYVSSKTQSVSITLTSVNGVGPATPVGAVVDVVAGSDCVVSGSNLNCTVSLDAPVGTDVFTVNTWPSTGAGGSMPLSTGTGTATVTANSNATLTVDLLPRVAMFAIDITPTNGTQAINTAGTFTARIRGKDSAGDIITGSSAYYTPIAITDKDIITAHMTASPALPATFTSPAQDTITFTYDGAGTAASYAFNVRSEISQQVNITLASNGQHLYVALRSANRIDVYDIQDDGSLTGPSRSLVGSHTGLNGPTSIAVTTLGELYVVNSYGNNITVYSPGATGDATPLSTNSVGTYPIYVADQAGMILTKTPKDPTTGAITITVNPNYPSGITFGTDPTLPSSIVLPFSPGSASAVAAYWNGIGGYFCANYVDSSDPNQNRVRCFSQPITWATKPGELASDYPNIQIFNGYANYKYTPAFVNAVDLKFLSSGLLVVSSNAKYQTLPALETYNINTGNVVTSIKGDSTGINSVGPIAVDSKSNLYLMNYGLSSGAGAVLQFAPGATGNVAPTHSLTGFNDMGGIAIGK